MTTLHLGGPNDCPNPIEAAVLMDYWLAALPSADEEAVEQHLMTCDGCDDRLREVIAMAEGLRALARSGSLQVVISDQFVKHAAETGLRVREYAPPRGEGVQCVFLRWTKKETSASSASSLSITRERFLARQDGS